MDNISKYPKDWYKQLTCKKKSREEQRKLPCNEKSHGSGQQKPLKTTTEKPDIPENGGDADDSSKAEESTTEWIYGLKREINLWIRFLSECDNLYIYIILKAKELFKHLLMSTQS